MKSNARIFTVIIFSISLAIPLFLLFLPFLCNTYLLPRLLDRLPFSHKELSLSTITPWLLQGSLRFVQDGVPVIAIPRFEIHYSLLSLMKGEIETLLLDSPSLQLHYADNALSLPQIEPKEHTAEQHSPLSFTLPVAVKNVSIRNSHLTLQTQTDKQDIILNGSIRCGFISSAQAEHTLTTLDADISTDGALRLLSHIKGVISTEGIIISADTSMPNLLELTNLPFVGRDQDLTGSLSAHGQLTLTPDLQLAHIKADAEVRQFHGSFSPSGSSSSFILTSPPSGLPVTIQIEGDHNSLSYHTSGLTLAQPEQIDLEVSGTINLHSHELIGKTILQSKRLDQPVTVETKVSQDAETITGKIHVSSAPLTLDNVIKLGPLEINGEISRKKENLVSQITGNLGYLAFPEQNITLKNLKWNLPFQTNDPKQQQQQQQPESGSLSIDTINYEGVDSAGFRAKLQQSGGGFNFTSSLVSRIDPPAQIDCNGSALFAGKASIACTLQDTMIDTARLPEYIKYDKNSHFIGTITANGNFEISQNKQKGSLKLNLSNGEFTSGKTEIRGIMADMVFPDLPDVRSLPGQKATIASIRSGKIALSDGRISFRIDNRDSLFLEKVRLSWCGGNIETGSLALNRQIQEIDTTIYCDRLGFVELLKQFGIEDTEGQGSLNGRLPVAITKDSIRFDDGFLFSTPGNSGIVRFNNTQQLREGMGNIGQTASLDYSIKALENFAYNWTKLSFNTEGDNLLLTMQLDGKPAEPLPFGYKDGQIVATEKGSGLQHPIQLDMNFRLPLQELFQYGKNLQSFMENM